MRNQYKDMAYFEKQASIYAERKNLSLEYIAKPNISENARQYLLKGVFDAQIDDFLWLYNTGHPIDEVVVALNKAWPLYIDFLEDTLNNSLEPHSKFHITPIDKLKYFPLLVLSDASTETAHRIFDFTDTVLNYAVDEKETKEVDVAFDGFLSHFAKYYDYESEKMTTEILDEKTCGLLNECFTSPDRRQNILIKYVEGWAHLDRQGYFYTKGAHKNSKNESFTGYWCFLGAAVAKMLTIDDSPLKEHPDYPYDLVHLL